MSSTTGSVREVVELSGGVTGSVSGMISLYSSGIEFYYIDNQFFISIGSFMV